MEDSKRRIVVYTDPAWAIDENGSVDPGRAWIEREIFPPDWDLRFGDAKGGRYDSSEPALRARLAGADAVAIYRTQVSEEFLEAAGEGLRVVARQGVGFDNLAPELLARRGIFGFNVPDYCIEEVATHTAAMLLALERRIVPQHDGLRSGRFDIYHGGTPRRLSHCTLGIVGFGRIGRASAARLGSIYGRVRVYDPYVGVDVTDSFGVERVDLGELLESSDAVLLHCTLTEETRGMVDRDFLSRMKRDALLINSARGAIVDAAALADALEQRRIGGAGIDVFSPENPHEDPASSRLTALPNTIVTSHRAFLSEESERSQRRRVAEGIVRVLREGRPPSVGHLTEGLRIRGDSLH